MADNDPLEQLIAETRAFADARPAPDFVSAVMCEVDRLDAVRTKRPRSWIVRTGKQLWTPRVVTFAFRPVYALFAAGAVLLLVAVLPNQLREGPLTTVAVQSGSERVYVQFRLQSAEALS